MDETFVNVWFDKDEKPAPTSDHGAKAGFYSKWTDQASAKYSHIPLSGADALRSIYPDYTVTMTMDYRINPLNYPGASATPLEKTPLVTNLVFIPFARSVGSLPGFLAEQVHYGAFNYTWEEYEFLLFTVTYPTAYGFTTINYILHKGPEDPARSLMVTLGAWAVQLHDEIWVYNDGYWQKDHALWAAVQKADWADVILKEDFKKALKKDVYGFFGSEEIYKELEIPWKRGLIMYGPPGNGKTISIKVIMKTCEDQGFTPLYVKSFKNWAGEERAMADVFDHARQMSPCVVILEDLDSLINDSNRSFFLNQLDGLTGNNGLLIIGTTNHFDRLDPGLSNRPSRFDRKFKFDDPDQEERTLYAQYWQKKLKKNKAVSFPDELVANIAQATDGFSFAYLKEAFVSSLVELAGYEGEDKPSFANVIEKQIKTLRKELDKLNLAAKPNTSGVRRDATEGTTPKRPARPSNERDVHALLDALSESINPNRLFNSRYTQERGPRNDRDVRVLLDALSETLNRANTINPQRSYEETLPLFRGGLIGRPSEDVFAEGRGILEAEMRAAQAAARIPHSTGTNLGNTSSVGHRAFIPGFEFGST